MKLRRLEIKNYRGISKLTWILDARFACLVGPDHSTNTTILDAHGCGLSPRRASCVCTEKLPHPLTVTVSPFFRVLPNTSRRASGDCVAAARDRPALYARAEINSALFIKWAVSGGNTKTCKAHARRQPRGACFIAAAFWSVNRILNWHNSCSY